MDQETAELRKAVHLTDDEFESAVIQSPKPVLVDFWADWCQPCRLIAPAIENLAGSHGDRITVAKLNVDSNPKTTDRYGIRSIPTLMLFKDGKVVEQIVGVQPQAEIALMIESHL